MKPPVSEIEAEKILRDFERKRKAQEVLGESEPWWFVWLSLLVATISAYLLSQGWFNTSEHTVIFLVVAIPAWLVLALYQLWYLSRRLEEVLGRKEVFGRLKDSWTLILQAAMAGCFAHKEWFNTSVIFLVVAIPAWLIASLCQVWYLSRHLEAAIELIKLNDEKQPEHGT